MASIAIDTPLNDATVHEHTAVRPSRAAMLPTYALALIFLWFGCLKFTDFEAEGIAPLIANSPIVGWWHSLFGIGGTARVLGVYEILTGLLLATRAFQPRLAAIGGAMASITFLVTLSFLFSTPGVIQADQDSPFALSGFPGGFLAKDIVLLAVGLATMIAARREARAR